MECKTRYNPPMYEWAIALFVPYTPQIGMRLLWKSGEKTKSKVVLVHGMKAYRKCELSATRTARFTLRQKNLLNPLNGWLGGPESRSDFLGEEKHCLSLPGIEIRFLGHAS